VSDLQRLAAGTPHASLLTVAEPHIGFCAKAKAAAVIAVTALVSVVFVRTPFKELTCVQITSLSVLVCWSQAVR
jgi:hypothetical protein